MTRRIVLAMAAVTAAVATALAVPMAFVVAQSQRAAFVADLQVQTMATAARLAAVSESQWPGVVATAAAQTGARFVVVDPTRTLLIDSDDSGADRAFDRPEIATALAGTVTSGVRDSQVLGASLRYVAAPVVDQSGVIAAVRMSLLDEIVDAAVRRTIAWLLVFIASVVAVAVIVAWWIARSMTRPLGALADVAHALPEDLSKRADASYGPTEVRSVASALNGTADRLEGLLSRAHRVAEDASHHLRTPLQGIRLRLEAIEDTAMDESTRDQASVALAETDRLAHRIDQVLALARADADVRLAVQDLAAVVRARVDAARPAYDDANIDLVVSGPETLPVQSQLGSIATIIDELLANALTYARSRVVVDIDADEISGRVTVRDDGSGIAPEDSERVFERFYRGAGAVVGGSGLGLALVKESAQAAGGGASVATAADDDLAGITVFWPLERL